MEFRNMVLMKLFVGQRHKEQTCGHSGGRKVGRKWGKDTAGQNEKVTLKYTLSYVK